VGDDRVRACRSESSSFDRLARRTRCASRTPGQTRTSVATAIVVTTRGDVLSCCETTGLAEHAVTSAARRAALTPITSRLSCQARSSASMDARGMTWRTGSVYARLATRGRRIARRVRKAIDRMSSRAFECCGCGKSFSCHSSRGPLPKWCDPCRSAARSELSKAARKSESRVLHLRVCQCCGADWKAKSRVAKFCSRRCQYVAAGSRVVLACQACGESFDSAVTLSEGRRFCSRECFLSVHRTAERTCVECGKTFRRAPAQRDKAKYCGRDCYFTARAAGRQHWDRGKIADAARERVWHRGGRYKHSPSAKAIREMASNMALHMSAVASLWRRAATARWCDVCGKQNLRPSSQYCSKACARTFLVGRECTECGKGILVAGESRRTKCKRCSKRNRLASNNRKRCRLYGVPYDSTIKSRWVFERDGYKCYLCGRKTRPNKNQLHPRYPTVDHVVPLSAGVYGHTADNVRCACRRCNEAKGAAWDGQLNLFASERCDAGS